MKRLHLGPGGGVVGDRRGRRARGGKRRGEGGGNTLREGFRKMKMRVLF